MASANVAWWSAGEARRNLTAVKLTTEVLALHLSLAADANGLVKQLADTLLIGDRDRGAGESALRAEIRQTFSKARELITREVPMRGQEEVEELERLALIERQLLAIDAEFAAIGRRREREDLAAVERALVDLLDRRVDSELHGLIEEAVAGERREVDLTRAEAEALLTRSRWLTGSAVAFTLLAAAAGIIFLRRGFSYRLKILMEGTRAISRGDLNYRVGLDGSDELAALSGGFDSMTAELQQARAVMQRSREALQEEVQARTAELEEANARLIQLDEARRKFLADVSHELRTPLTIMRGEAQVTLRHDRGSLEAEAKQALVTVVEQANQMGRLVDDLLFVARREAGEARLALRPTPLAPLVESVVQDARTLAREQGVEIELEIAAARVVVEADPGRLRQLVMVLLDNAVRYSPKGGAVRVRAVPTPQGVAVQVDDEGIGIPDADLPHIFDRFVRGSNALPGGSGLGLPVAKAIAEAHGGTLTLESSEGKGVRATLILPRANPVRIVA
jgi:signal transduction histidine kinase